MTAQPQSAAAAAAKRRTELRRELAAQVREVSAGPLDRLRMHLRRFVVWTLGLFVIFNVVGFFAVNGPFDSLLDGPADAALWALVCLVLCAGIAVVLVVSERATPRRIWATQLKLRREPTVPGEPPVVVPPELMAPPWVTSDPLLQAHPEVLEKSDRTLRRMLAPGTRQHHDVMRLSAFAPGYLDAASAELARRSAG